MAVSRPIITPFQLFLMATVEPYNLNWSAGENNMLLVSVGTGTTPNIYEDIQPSDMHKLFLVPPACTHVCYSE